MNLHADSESDTDSDDDSSESDGDDIPRLLSRVEQGYNDDDDHHSQNLLYLLLVTIPYPPTLAIAKLTVSD